MGRMRGLLYISRIWGLKCMALQWADCAWRVYGTYCVWVVYGA